MYRKLLLLFLPLFVLSCKHKQEEVLVIESFKQLTEIPSASGVEIVDGDIWMVGDDSPFLFQFDKQLNLKEKYSLSSINNKVGNRVIKTDKADFESIVYVGGMFLVAGSGSKDVSRDTLAVFHKESKSVAKTNMRPLYEKFKKNAAFTNNQQINIEGIATSKDFIYFLNRGNIGGNNDIFRLTHQDFTNYLNLGDSVLKIEYQRYNLPEIDGYLSGFSGAYIDEDNRFLYFTASVEATRDVYNDGEVLGSFIGRLNLETQDLISWPLKKEGQFIKTKLESISIIQHKPEFIRFVCTSDNDDGSSGVYHLKLNLKIDSYE